MLRLRNWVVGLLVAACVMLAACGRVPQAPTDLPGPVVPTRAPTAVAPTSQAPPPTSEPPQPASMDAPVDVPRQTVFGGRDGGSINIGGTYEGEIADRDYAVWVKFEGQAGQTVDIEMNDIDGTLDTYLILLDGSGRELARNDDRDDEQTNSLLVGISLMEADTYTIVATRFRQRFGRDKGAFELEVRESDPVGEPSQRAGRTSYGVMQEGTINDDTPQQVYAFQGNAGDVVTVSMANISGNLDPTVKLTDAFGNELAINEDINILNNFNARIDALVLPYSGYYTIVATRYQERFGDTAGRFEVQVQRGERLPPEQQRLNMRAALDDEESNTLLADERGVLETGWYVGDRLDDEQEVRAQVVLTYYIIAPPAPDPNEVLAATLDLSECDSAGLGFEAVGGYNVYVDDVGRMTSQMLFNPSPRAELVGNFNACSDVDVTEWVRDAFDGPGSVIQFRVLPQATLENDQADSVVFLDPRLTVQFGSEDDESNE